MIPSSRSRLRLPEPRRKDPYRTRAKPKGRPQCPSCKAICVRGRWTQDAAIAGGRNLTCPACQQSRDRYAGGVVVIQNWRARRARGRIAQILGTIRNTEAIARARNDQERVLWFQRRRGELRIYVTLPELARQIGRTLRHSFKGKTEYHRSTEEPFLRVIWGA